MRATRSRGPSQRTLPLLLLASLAWGVATPAGAALQDPPPTPSERPGPRQLAERFLEGDDDAAAELVRRGPEALPAVRELFVGPDGRKKWGALVRKAVRAALDRSLAEEADLRYHGQFDSLKALGPEGGDAALAILCDEDVPVVVRNRAAGALGDLGEPRHLPRLREVVEDFLSEAWLEREAGYLMARLGDRSFVDRILSRSRQVIQAPATTANVPGLIAAHTELAEVHYRIGEYASAIKHYRQKLALLVGLRENVQPALVDAVQDEINLLHYNLACSLALAGRIDESFAALEIALESTQITPEMVAADGDLRAVRAEARFAEWFERVRRAAPRLPGGDDPGGAERKP